MSTKNKIKLLIPNLLTGFRIMITPFIIALGFMGHFKIVIILIILAALSDLFDGKLARKFHTVSEFGAKLDTISDKVFAIGLSLAILNAYRSIFPIIVLEIVIACINIYFYYKNDNVKSLMIGKIKTTSLFITIIFVYIFVLTKNLNFINTLIHGLIYTTINLQILSILFYIYYNLNFAKEIKIETDFKDDELEKTILVNSIEDLTFENNYDNDII